MLLLRSFGRVRALPRAVQAPAVAQAVRGISTVPGLMQDFPLTMHHLFWRAEKLFPDKEVVSYSFKGRESVAYGDWAQDVRRFPAILDKLGVKRGGRVGTFAWNTKDHLSLWFGVPCSGRILHTLNIRLFPEQLTYIVNHAENEVVFVDRSLLPLFWPHQASFKTVRHFVIMDDGKPDVQIPSDPRIIMFDDLMKSVQPGDFPKLDERDACGMCYTSGTTGNPKGVVYTHRSTFLHTMGISMTETIAIRESDTLLPVVPMFHANAWGLAHAAPTFGAKLIMPGPFLQGKPLCDMLEKEKVTVTAGVPTIWMSVLAEIGDRDLSSLRMIGCGGSAVPKNLSRGFRLKTGLPITQAWGMTETSPVAAVNFTRSNLKKLDEDKLDDIRALAGIPVFGCEVRICEPGSTKELPWDGKTTGELQIRGPWICSAYYNRPDAKDSFTNDGYLCTGDVAAITKEGYLRFTDRTKDLIKTGGEWISSVEVENEIMANPKVKEAAVIAVPSQKWMERPLACVVLHPGQTMTHHELIEFLTPRMAKWWLPDATEFVSEIPKTSVGKFSKKDLRKKFENFTLP